MSVGRGGRVIEKLGKGLQSCHGDGKYSARNIVNIVVTVCGVGSTRSIGEIA